MISLFLKTVKDDSTRAGSTLPMDGACSSGDEPNPTMGRGLFVSPRSRAVERRAGLAWRRSAPRGHPRASRPNAPPASVLERRHARRGARHVADIEAARAAAGDA